jgi:hypothetical protein
MAHHPRGTTVDIVGIEASGNGRSCEEHAVCGSVLAEDSVVRIRCVQVVIDGLEESALACFWITDGIDQCWVGFLPKHYVKNWEDYEGRLAQVVEFYKDSDSPEKRKSTQKSGESDLHVIKALTPSPNEMKVMTMRMNNSMSNRMEKRHKWNNKIPE